MSRRTRARHRGPTPPKTRPAEQRAKREIADLLDPLPQDVRQRVLTGAIAATTDRSRTEDDVRDLLRLAEREGVGGEVFNDMAPEGDFLAVIRRSSAETIQRILAVLAARSSGDPRASSGVTDADVQAALADWRKAIESERDHMTDQLEKLDVVREMRMRQALRLDSRLMDAELASAFLPRSGQEITLPAGRLRALAMREPSLLAAAQTSRTYFTTAVAREMFDEVLAATPEWGAFEPEYLERLRHAVARRYPEVAADAGISTGIEVDDQPEVGP